VVNWLKWLFHETLFCQLFQGFVLYLGICYLKDRQLPFSWSHLKQGIAGIFEPALAYMFGIFGIQMTSASNATLIASSEVILTIVFAPVFLGERVTRMKLLLSSINASGIVLLLLKDTQSPNYSCFSGDLLVLAGTIFAVCYVLLSKKQIATADPLHLTSSQQLVGLIVTVFCFSLLSTINPSYEISATGISPQFWFLAVLSGIMQYALAFLLYLIALQNIPVSHAAFYTALIPIFGIASAVVLIGEQPSLEQWIGGLLVIVSSYCANSLKTT
jgi:drug/metabolite transporter (DMT)-like permease